MEISQQEAYEASLMIIGKMIVEQHFYQKMLQEREVEQKVEEETTDSTN